VFIRHEKTGASMTGRRLGKRLIEALTPIPPWRSARADHLVHQTDCAFSTKRVTTQFLVFESGRLSLISTTSPMWNSLFSS